LLAPETVSATSLTFPRGYRSTWSWALGVEHRWSSRLALRLGYENRPSAIPKNKADLLAPFGAAVLLGAGFAWQLSPQALLEVGIGRLVSRTSVSADTSKNANSMGYDNLIYNPYAGYHLTSSVIAHLLEVSYQSAF
jgi:long-subunit fatty acid transport protein